ncbi:hypothetical protein ABZ921_09725 [Streptomyces atriruber]|uniref:Bacteriocin immunity protein n=1 Tax=Streptomyces atriruber TaxID=545121 RepID=A0ABV3BIR8_9ACTN
MAPGDMTRAELVELVRRISIFDGTEEEVDAMEDLFEASVPYPDAYGLIYQREPELSPEEIVDKALAYQAIAPPYNPGTSRGSAD